MKHKILGGMLIGLSLILNACLTETKKANETTYWKYKETLNQYYSGKTVVFDTTSNEKYRTYDDELKIFGDSALSYKYLVDQGCVSVNRYKIISRKDSLLFEQAVIGNEGKHELSYRTFRLEEKSAILYYVTSSITQWTYLCLYYNSLDNTVNNLCSLDNNRTPLNTDIKITDETSMFKLQKVDSSEIELKDSTVCSI